MVCEGGTNISGWGCREGVSTTTLERTWLACVLATLGISDTGSLASAKNIGGPSMFLSAAEDALDGSRCYFVILKTILVISSFCLNFITNFPFPLSL